MRRNCYRDSAARKVTSTTHFNPYYKRQICKQWRPRSDAAERGVWSGSTPFVLNTETSLTNDNTKTKESFLKIGNGIAQNKERGFHEAETDICIHGAGLHLSSRLQILQSTDGKILLTRCMLVKKIRTIQNLMFSYKIGFDISCKL